MAKDIRVVMKQFNGVDYNEIYPDASNGVMAQIIVTPTSTLSSIKATSPSGAVFNGVFKNPNWIIEVNEYGNYTIQGTKTAGGTDSTELIVDECKQYEVRFIPPSNPILNNNSWEIIRKYSDLGLAESTWAVGDAKQITIDGKIGKGITYNNYQPWVYILGFNHNAEKEGNNRIHFGCFRSEQNYSDTNSIALTDIEYGSYTTMSGYYFCINSHNSNTGGWKNCQMRLLILNADATSPSSAADDTFLKILPEDLKSVMKSCTKYTDNVGGGNVGEINITTTTDWIWLLSEFEVFGKRTYANEYEQNYQKQYDYYKNGNSKIKYRQDNIFDAAYWWTRSTIPNSGKFCLIKTNGVPESYETSSIFAIAPAFCV